MSGNWFDIVLLLILFTSTVSGLRAGLARVIIGLVSTVVGLLTGFWCYRMVAVKILPLVQTETAANILGFLIIFFGVLIVGSVLSALLSRLFQWIGLSWFNHLLGGAAGLVRGALVIAALVDVAVAFSPSPTPRFISNSQVLPYADELSGWLVQLAPRELKDMFVEQMENLKRIRKQPKQDNPEEAFRK
jgi:membrane protein required for colicin V production